MSIKVLVQAPGLNLQATVTDQALPELIRVTQAYRDETIVFPAAADEIGDSVERPVTAGNEDVTKARLASYGAAELLNRVPWENYPDRILLLGAWHESREGQIPWKSSDMDGLFKQAKERPPANFPRDIKNAIKAGWIRNHTPRTYSVTRTGWNRIADALAQLGG